MEEVRSTDTNGTSMSLLNATNDSTSVSSSENVLYSIMVVELYFKPVICLFGRIGNTLSVITFLRAPLRETSCNIYLVVRSISDNGFLLTLFLIWTSTVFNLRLSHVRGVCETVVFFTYICGCVSIWLVVFVTM